MTRIDFYHNAEDRLRVSCRLIAKAVQQKLRVVVYAPDGALARAVDEMLWAEPTVQFLPHVMAEHRLAAQTPIVIARDPQSVPHDQVLLNLHSETLPAFARFERLLEVVGPDEADRQAARTRFKFYKERGYPLQAHDLAAVRV